MRMLYRPTNRIRSNFTPKFSILFIGQKTDNRIDTIHSSPLCSSMSPGCKLTGLSDPSNEDMRYHSSYASGRLASFTK